MMIHFNESTLFTLSFRAFNVGGKDGIFFLFKNRSSRDKFTNMIKIYMTLFHILKFYDIKFRISLRLEICA